MLFMIHYEVKPENRDAGIERFLKIGQGEPEGVKTIRQWYSVTQLEGWVIIEGNDEREISKQLYVWTDLNVNKITPVLEGGEMGRLLAELRKEG